MSLLNIGIRHHVQAAGSAGGEDEPHRLAVGQESLAPHAGQELTSDDDAKKIIGPFDLGKFHIDDDGTLFLEGRQGGAHAGLDFRVEIVEEVVCRAAQAQTPHRIKFGHRDIGERRDNNRRVVGRSGQGT